MILAASVVAIMRTTFEQAFPDEAAGFLLGAASAGWAVVTDVFPARTSPGRGEFNITNQEITLARAWADDRRLDLLALFHTHPSGDSRLSATDRAGLAHSEWPWLIITRSVAPAGIESTAYRPGDGKQITVTLGGLS